MAEIKFNYCGFESYKDLGLITNDTHRSVTAELKEQTTDIPGMLGDLYEGTSLGSKKIDIDVTLISNTEEDRVYTLRELSNLITQTTDGDEYPLIFSDEPDVTWWVHPISISAPTRIAKNSRSVSFTMSFSCAEGVGYQTKEEIQLTKETTTYTPKGNTTTRPVLTLTTDSNLSKIGVANGDEYVYLGAGFDAENQDAPINLKPRILNDPCNTLATWTKLNDANLTFLLQGKIATNADFGTTPNAIEMGKKNGKPFYGTNPNGVGKGGWYGPVRQQFLSKACDDWQVTARMIMDNKYSRAKAKIELYLLDAKGMRIGKIMIKDAEYSLENMIDIQIGYDSAPNRYKPVYLSSRDGQGKVTSKNNLKPKKISFKTISKVTDKKKKIKKGDVISKAMTVEQSNAKNIFTDFYGNLILKKEGNKYTATVEKLDKKGLVSKKFSKTFTDSTNKYGDKLAGVALYMSKWDIKEDSSNPVVEYNQNYTSLCDVKVYDILGKEKQLVAEAGDEIIIDCENNAVYKNGIRYLENVAIGSQFFDAEAKQENVVTVYPEPDSKNKWELSYVPRIN